MPAGGTTLRPSHGWRNPMDDVIVTETGVRSTDGSMVVAWDAFNYWWALWMRAWHPHWLPVVAHHFGAWRERMTSL